MAEIFSYSLDGTDHLDAVFPTGVDHRVEVIGLLQRFSVDEGRIALGDLHSGESNGPLVFESEVDPDVIDQCDVWKDRVGQLAELPGLGITVHDIGNLVLKPELQQYL